MGAILTDVDAWVLWAGLAAAMVASWGAGWWLGGRLTKEGREARADKFPDASVALLGLLLGFTFSMALSKHDQRRLMVVTDSNALGDFYTCASLVKEPVRGKLRTAIRVYVEHRLALATETLDAPTFEKNLAELVEMHGQMQGLVGEAVDGGTPVTVPLVNTLNEVTSSHAARLAALRDRRPFSVVALLFLAAVVSMLLMGTQQGASKQARPGEMIAFVFLVSMAIWVTLDLNQPQRGLITVSQEPMQRLLAGMDK